MTQQPTDPLEARKEMRRRRRRRRRIIRILLVVAIALLLLVVGFFVIMTIIGKQAAKNGETTSFLAVKGIQVEGETRYSAEELIQKSGLYVGQSLLAVNKVQAHDALLASFPYLSTVEVSNASFDTLQIRVTETAVLGAVQTPNGWFIWGDNNHALERLEETALPADILRIVGAVTAGDQLGKPLLEERSLRVCRRLVEAAKQYGLTTLREIDITEKTNISMKVGAGMQVLLGNETNLEEQVETLVNTLPTLLANNGADAAGRLDMTSYADDDPGNNKSIYTSEELLADKDQVTPPSGSGGEDSAGTTAGTTGSGTTATAP